MKTCPDCDRPLEFDDAAFCTQCGARIAPPPPEESPPPSEEVDGASESAPLGGSQQSESLGAGESNSRRADDGRESGEAAGAAARSEAVGFGGGVESAGPVETPGLAVDDVDDDGLPLTLEFNQSVFLIDGCAGVMECRVRTSGGEPIEEVGVSLASDALGEVAGATVPKLSPGRDRVVGLPITPSAVGTHHLTASVVYEHRGRVYAAVAFHRVTVLEQNASPASIQIHYENRVEASDNAVVSNRGGNLTGLDKMIAAGRATVNDLLSQQAAPSWLALDLEPDDVLTRELRRRRRDIVRPVRFHDTFTKPADRLGLVSAGLMAGAGEARLSAQVLASLPLGMGRSRQAADLVMRVLPRSESNDKASQMISGSRPQLYLRMDQGAPVLEDPGSANGTWVNAQRLEAALPLDPLGPTRVDLAHVLSLQFTPIAGEVEPERYERLGGQDDLWRWGEAHGIAAFRVEFIEERGSGIDRPPVFVPVRWVDLVEDAHAGLTAVPHVGRVPAVRLVRTGDGLWTEACIDGITVNQRPLDRSSAVPMALGDTLASGGYTTRLDTFVQHVG